MDEKGDLTRCECACDSYAPASKALIHDEARIPSGKAERCIASAQRAELVGRKGFRQILQSTNDSALRTRPKDSSSIKGLLTDRRFLPRATVAEGLKG